MRAGECLVETAGGTDSCRLTGARVDGPTQRARVNSPSSAALTDLD